jgi:hypothetical protein
MAMNQPANHATMNAPEFVSLLQWMQERRDICGLLSLYATARPHETLLQQLARVLRSLDTRVSGAKTSTTLILSNGYHFSQI